MGAIRAEVVVCGAGIAGVAAAYSLTVHYGVKVLLLVDERPALSLTSDKSTEAYRNWWPGPEGSQVSLMNRSIDLLERLAGESGNTFQLNRRGYLYATASLDRARTLRLEAESASRFGAGPLRVHAGQRDDPPYQPAPAEGYQDQPIGADLILDRGLLRERFPYLTHQAVAGLHVRRAGWFSGQQLGSYLLQKARQNGARLLQGRVASVKARRGRVEAVEIELEDRRETALAQNFVVAAGPFIRHVSRMLGIDLPVYCERHLKVSLADHLGVVPRDAPLLIWEDEQHLPWKEEEKSYLLAEDGTRWMLERLPSGVHCRPEGGLEGQSLLLLWPYHVEAVEPVFPLESDPFFPEIALRGMATMIPGVSAYFDRIPRTFVDGGYYTRTRENRLLVGPLPVQGAYLIGALSGYGLMAACAAGELLAKHLTGESLPDYAQAFSLERYRDVNYLKLLEDWGPTGQL